MVNHSELGSAILNSFIANGRPVTVAAMAQQAGEPLADVAAALVAQGTPPGAEVFSDGRNGTSYLPSHGLLRRAVLKATKDLEKFTKTENGSAPVDGGV
jgi:hypothetical protein